MRNRDLAMLAVLVMGLAAGCSLVTDTEKQQCKKAEDCGSFNGAAVYVCEDRFCRYVACSSDSECAARGDFVCEDSRCAPALCLEKADCGEGGEECVAGRCIDPVFWCFNEEPALSSPDEPVISVTVLAYGDKKPVTELAVTVCSIADTPCNTPLDVTWTYSADGKLQIRGLENGLRYSVRFKAKDSKGTVLNETEYYMQRPVVGFSQEADRFEMIPTSLIELLAVQAGVQYDAGKGLVIAEIFGCDDKPLAGVSVTNNRAGTLFYLTGTPNPNATETDNLGQAGVVNMETLADGSPLNHTLTFSYEGKEMYSFTMPARRGVLTFLNLYMPDYGSTENRAASFQR